MKSKKPNQTPTPPDSSSAPPRPPPYSFVPPPIPFYPTPPPPWCPWPVPPPGPPPHGFHIAMPQPPPADALQPGQHIPPALPPYGMWPPPGAYPLPHMVMGPIMPPARPPPIVTQSNSQEKTQVSVTLPTNMAPNMSQVEPPPMSTSNSVVQPPPSPPGSNLNGSSDRTSQLPPPLRKRPVTRKSAAWERDTSGDPEQTPTPSSKGSQARRVKSKKCKDVEEKITPVQDESEDNVVDEQKSPKNGIRMAETSEGEENNVPLPKLGSEPYVGLRFGSEDEAYEFYNAYAKEKGFSIRKSHIQRSRVDRSVISREYVCASQGSRSTNDRRYKGKIVRPRRETRVNCRAAVSIKRRSQKWVVDRFHKEHNHGLVDPTRAEKLRSHRKITSTTKTVIDALYKSRIGPSKIIDVLAKAASAENNVEIGALDLMKYMKKERKNNIVADLYYLLEYFQGIQALDPGFLYAVEVGENRSMRSIFWADNRAREAYKQFGDVMTFDTPFQTNKDLFPFASFTGLNHHRQAVLFGCGFLADETMESYIWFFQTFLKVMSNKEPSSVVTVRDKAMMLAIEKVFPKASHRFCMLHIEKNEQENLGEIFNMHPDFQSEYKKCIYSSRKPEEFESGWKTLVGKYGLKDNSWLNGMYDQCHYWVPVYLQNTFFAGMTTTRMDQGMNYFDGFMHDGTPLEEFIPQYELALKRRREEEADEDFMTMYTSAGSISKNPIEEQAARVYTRNVFTIFSQEFYESSGCITRRTDNDLASMYLVGKHDDKDGEMNTVTFYSDNKSANCSCHMFELEGMLCRHVLKVFQEVNVLEIPPKYILKRWTMSARYVGLCNDEAGGGFQDPTVNIWTLKRTAIKFIELGATSSERINKAISVIDDGMQQLSLVNVSTSYSPPEDMDCNSFQGEKVNSSSSQELEPNEAENHSAASKTKPDTIQTHNKKRKCSTCNRTGHYTSICPRESVIQSQISTSVASTL